MNKPKLLFLMQLPPPVHGSSLLCSFIQQGETIREAYQCEFIDISSEEKLISIGAFKVGKLFKSITRIFKSWWAFLRIRPHLVYIALTPTGLAFYRDAVLVLLLKASRARIVFQLHCKGLENATRSKESRWLYRRVFKNCDVIQSDELLHEDIRNCFDPQCRAYFVANGCPDHGPSSEKSPPDKPLKILYLSNYIPSKGAHVLVEALNLLPADYANRFSAVLAGGITDGSYYEKLQQLAEQRYPDQIEVLGPKYGDEKNQLFSECDVFVLPTRYHNECFPVSLLEGMSHSAAVLSTNEGAIESIIDVGVNGYIFDPAERRELMQLIRDYIDNRDLLRKHQLAARAKYEHQYRVEHFQRRTHAALEDILRRHYPGRTE